MKDDQRVALSKRLLREGLLRLLERREIDSIRVSELCAESGINRATFYRHYQRPRDILRDLRHSILQEAQRLAGPDMGQSDPLLWLEELCSYCWQQRQLLRVLFLTRTDDEFVALIRELYSQQLGRLRRWHGAAADEDSLKLSLYFYAGGFYYILRQWILEPLDKSPRQIAAVLYGILMEQPGQRRE